VVAGTEPKETFQVGQPVEDRTEAKTVTRIWAVSGDTICERQNQGITVISELGIYRARPKSFQDAYAAIRNDKLKTGDPGPKRDEAGP
jgi:hypothetical protein